ncbi:glycerol-3-phosphate acyltransferase [Gloeocapsopsis dulcis]|uniref:Pyruvate phosphate dikinase PEP/pyruvate-binding protein n=1 Tax=Gloeocapsopsis dulcis AAB1 = 1H9 TaxID=1433147 RepID=A0A6N8FVB9_9CHRO|nr:glycerol-3-phosphate acyltransferase [Gloeocapsopsis dulcis]MUL37068.1 pyruvate phosphate dikinase PEP/pyruvate-binding protein [Gloeocapsopsis dulcis AAB1 = 1H9]WNN87922.1 glycerol-3-phosphate acyltransferase [Gloeocapsopsis dulcis]
MLQVWGAIAIFLICPLIGGLPLIAGIVSALSGRNLGNSGTGNISVSAAFYYGGKLAGILAVLSEALKGIAAVLLARAFFPQDPVWELIALIALVMGRYWIGGGAGTTNVVWGFIVHDPVVAGLVFLIGGISFTVLRERQLGKFGVLILFPLLTALLRPHDSARIVAAIALAILLGWIYQKMPDDLDLAPDAGHAESQKVFRFFRGDKAIVSLSDELSAAQVGQKAATLSQLIRWGYPVPKGWVLPPGDDSEPLVNYLPLEKSPLVVRSSAVGEDSQQASAAGQYKTVLGVASKEQLQQAIATVLASYDNPAAIEYRKQRGLPESAMAVLIQQQVQGVFSGVAFSRDPMTQQGDTVVIEALPGDASKVVSGQVTPEQYRVIVSHTDLEHSQNWVLPEHIALSVEGEGDIPPRLIQQVAFLARHLEARYHGIPQDIEWSYDGKTLWLLQSRPITTLLPIWTRKIAAEVIPGLIRPLTWSINRPLTCGVWGEIFTVVLGSRARGLDFNQTATLHYSHAYFNASLLGRIFLRMGLPPESLEFLTRGAKFSKPPLRSTVRNIPGLMRLLSRELNLAKDFQKDDQQYFQPALIELNSSDRDPVKLLSRIDLILELLKKATYYSILAPLSVALRQAMFKTKDVEIDYSLTPEVASMRSLVQLAGDARRVLPESQNVSSEEVFTQLAETNQGREIIQRFDQLLERYGYLSEVGTDIAVPTWREEPKYVRELFVQFVVSGDLGENEPHRRRGRRGKRVVQGRVDLKGRVTEVYSQLLAHLRWCFVALERVWLESGLLVSKGDIFFLEFAEVRRIVVDGDSKLSSQLKELVEQRRSQLEQDSSLDVPLLVYGHAPPTPSAFSASSASLLQGIGASPGKVEGRVKVLRNLQATSEIDRETILVVPYTDSGWAPLLARSGGLIAEAGGRLSHGAIVAREYGLPAVMDIHNATVILQDGQRVQIDGQLGTVQILAD